TAVRIPLSQADWLGRRCPASTYAEMVDKAIANANSRGMYVILDLHWSDVGGAAPCDSGCLSGQQPMPDSDSLRFWQQLARRYRTVGLQQLYDAVRATGARNLVLAAGLDWGFDLSGVGQGYVLSGSNVAYDTHVYFPWHSAPSDWDAHFGYLTSGYPITATEF